MAKPRHEMSPDEIDMALQYKHSLMAVFQGMTEVKCNLGQHKHR